MSKKSFLPFLCLFIIFIVIIISSLKKFSYPLVLPDKTGSAAIILPKFSLRFPYNNFSENNSAFTLVAGGDIMLGRFVNVKILESKDWRYPFLKTAGVISSADVAFANLEAPFSENCPTVSEGMIFCARKESIEGLRYAGFDVLSIANNHAPNYGQKGIEYTKTLLTQNNLLFSDNQLVKLKVNNLTLGFLSFDLITYPNLEVVERVRENTGKVDILIVSLHWGTEYSLKPSNQQINLARQIIDTGAKVIIGHHPHVVQPTESYHQGLIFYSLGNFVFDQSWSQQTKEGKIAKITFEGKEIKTIEEIPILIENSSQPQLIQKSADQ